MPSRIVYHCFSPGCLCLFCLGSISWDNSKIHLWRAREKKMIWRWHHTLTNLKSASCEGRLPNLPYTVWEMERLPNISPIKKKTCPCKSRSTCIWSFFYFLLEPKKYLAEYLLIPGIAGGKEHLEFLGMEMWWLLARVSEMSTIT